ncbi:MAG: 16S rRNA (uracil(1498)-N(3))-methyltransferase [Ignavibacteriales bacterium]|nr:MAG: 16S rRNA (uracil(1498)-N(3))-methyltransferase [Ignavibacteriales bacterium]
MNFLSGVELYYSSEKIKENSIYISGDDYKHIIKVMRHSVGDEIYITSGRGEIYLSTIKQIEKDSLTASKNKVFKYENEFSNIFFCIPKLKSNERLEFALEKCTELGITNFIIFDSERAVHKSDKKERWQKIVLSAMKQSLRSYLPTINIINSVDEILELEGRKILLEQNSENQISELKINKNEKYFFIYGPEGGLTKEELNLFDEKYRLDENRLRTETAVIKCASIITT